MRSAVRSGLCALAVVALVVEVGASDPSRLYDQIDLFQWGTTMTQFDSTMSGVCQFAMEDQAAHNHRYGDVHDSVPYEIIPGFFDDTLIGALFRFQVVDASGHPMKATLKALSKAFSERFGKPTFKSDAKEMMKYANFPRALTHWQAEGGHWILSHYLSSQGQDELMIVGLGPALFDWYREDFEDTTTVVEQRELTLFENAVSWFPARSLLNEAQLTPLGEAMRSRSDAGTE